MTVGESLRARSILERHGWALGEVFDRRPERGGDKLYDPARADTSGKANFAVVAYHVKHGVVTFASIAEVEQLLGIDNRPRKAVNKHHGSKQH